METMTGNPTLSYALPLRAVVRSISYLPEYCVLLAVGKGTAGRGRQVPKRETPRQATGKARG